MMHFFSMWVGHMGTITGEGEEEVGAILYEIHEGLV